MVKHSVAQAGKTSPIGVFPASFDPLHVGHISVIERAARLLDKLYVAIAVNAAKTSEFSLEERRVFVAASIAHIENAEVVVFEKGLTADHARELGAAVMVRGMRQPDDCRSELELFGQNLIVQPARHGPKDDGFVDTQLYFALPGQEHISSSLIRQLMHMPASTNRLELIRPLVPEPVLLAIKAHLSSTSH